MMHAIVHIIAAAVMVGVVGNAAKIGCGLLGVVPVL